MEPAEGGEEWESDEGSCEVDEPPLLKFHRLQAKVGAELSNDAAVCLALFESWLVVGFASGTVLVVDRHGQELARYRPHGKPVNAISIDSAGSMIATCADDGLVTLRPGPRTATDQVGNQTHRSLGCSTRMIVIG